MVCDYVTILMRYVDAQHVAKGLLVLFSRAGIPEEILSDQGVNFTSQLLAELY